MKKFLTHMFNHYFIKSPIIRFYTGSLQYGFSNYDFQLIERKNGKREIVYFDGGIKNLKGFGEIHAWVETGTAPKFTKAIKIEANQ